MKTFDFLYAIQLNLSISASRRLGVSASRRLGVSASRRLSIMLDEVDVKI